MNPIITIVFIVVFVAISTTIPIQVTSTEDIKYPKIIYKETSLQNQKIINKTLIENTKKFWLYGVKEIIFTTKPLGRRGEDIVTGRYGEGKIEVMVQQQKLDIQNIAITYCHELFHHHGLMDGQVIEELEPYILCLANKGVEMLYANTT